jgi:beta-mannosidase
MKQLHPYWRLAYFTFLYLLPLLSFGQQRPLKTNTALDTSQPVTVTAIGPDNMAEAGTIGLASHHRPDSLVKPLWQPYYIFPRSGSKHISLVGNWQLTYLDSSLKSVQQLDTISDWLVVKENSTVHTTLYQSGKLPDPYEKMNADQYRWVEQKVWYYRKNFTVSGSTKDDYHFLSFDGIDYFARIWVNDSLVGRHEGMFAGPAIEITDLIRFDKPNTVVVEVISANYRSRKKFNPKAPGRVIKGWAFTGGTGVENFFTVGMWRGARLDIMPPVHLERPFIVTKSASADKAVLSVSTELLVRKHSLQFQLHPWGNAILSRGVVSTKLKKAPEKLKLRIELAGEDKKTITREYPLEVFEGRNWPKNELTIQKPALWWPNGMGKPHLYKLKISLLDNNIVIDKIEMDYGIRTIETKPNAGPQVEERWKNWHFAINGRPVFLKAINWMPADVLLNLPKERYHWLLGMMKASGIQLVRVWGSGLMETEEFYTICNQLGLMVWQDFPLSHFDAPEYPADVWEAQILQNVFRLRNHPSLAVYNGGNGLNPYSHGNNRTLGILERMLTDYDPSRLYSRTTSDAGNAHLYPDMDPSYYAELYRYIPFISETGMHSIGDPKGLSNIISKKELMDLGNIYSEEFAASHKEFIAHFAEFEPSRVPRMLSRASHIDDMHAPTIESIAEATQVGAGEFYQVLSDGIQGNYPFNNGLMPWVFNRTWPVVSGIMLVDGFGHPAAPYYFLKRTYEQTHVKLDLSRLLWSPGEQFPVNISVINAATANIPATVTVRILAENFKPVWKISRKINVRPGVSVTKLGLGSFMIPSSYQDKYFFCVVELTDDNNNKISRSVYWPRSLNSMMDSSYRNKQLNLESPAPWPTFKAGPWLKPAVAATATSLKLQMLDNKSFDSNTLVRVRVTNTGKAPAFMLQLDVEGAKRVAYSNDNYCWLDAGETKDFNLTVRWRESRKGKETNLVVFAWNAARQVVRIGE